MAPQWTIAAVAGHLHRFSGTCRCEGVVGTDDVLDDATRTTPELVPDRLKTRTDGVLNHARPCSKKQLPAAGLLAFDYQHRHADNEHPKGECEPDRLRDHRDHHQDRTGRIAEIRQPSREHLCA